MPKLLNQPLALSVASAASSALTYCYMAGMRASDRTQAILLHPEGLSQFPVAGAAIFETPTRQQLVERWTVLFPEQYLPAHTYPSRCETLEVVAGSLTITIGNERRIMNQGETLDIPNDAVRSFSTDTKGCILRSRCSTVKAKTILWAGGLSPYTRAISRFNATDGNFFPLLQCMIPMQQCV